MIIDGKITNYNTQKELREIEDSIIKAALSNWTYWDIIDDLKKKNVNLQYEDTERNTRHLVRRITSKTWTEIKHEIQQKSEDYSGITPTRQGYKYKDNIFENLEDAHQSKLKCESPKLARIMYS